MVNLGRSWGCRMCKQRRIKCDETAGGCRRRARSGYTCPGYDAGKSLRIRFKDETALVVHRSGSGRTPVPSPAVLHEHFETQALNFFVMNFATAGRDQVSTRRLWESVAPTLRASPATSPVVDAAAAVGGILFNVWRLHKHGPHARNPAFLRAIHGLRIRLAEGPIDGPEVLMTILLLQFHENLATVFSLRAASKMHYNGALGLIRSLPIKSFSTVASRGLLLDSHSQPDHDRTLSFVFSCPGTFTGFYHCPHLRSAFSVIILFAICLKSNRPAPRFSGIC